MEGEFAPGAAAVYELFVLGEFLAVFRPTVDPVADSRMLALLPVILAPAGRIAVDLFSLDLFGVSLGADRRPPGPTLRHREPHRYPADSYKKHD